MKLFSAFWFEYILEHPIWLWGIPFPPFPRICSGLILFLCLKPLALSPQCRASEGARTSKDCWNIHAGLQPQTHPGTPALGPSEGRQFQTFPTVGFSPLESFPSLK